MKRVVLESPFAGRSKNPLLAWWQRLQNKRYARRCLRDCLARGESPIASHLLYTQVLDDGDEQERQWGIDAGLAWGEVADGWVVYVDRDISRGMRYGIAAAKAAGKPIEYRGFFGSRAAAPVSPAVLWPDLAEPLGAPLARSKPESPTLVWPRAH